MKVTRTGSEAFSLEFESEQELRDEHRVNLSQRALRLATSEVVPLHTSVTITLRGPWGGEAVVRATVVAALPDGPALGIEEGDGDLLLRLLSNPAEELEESSVAGEGEEGDSPGEKRQTAWDRVRSLSQMEKILLAAKASRTDRAVLLQESDPRILLSLLRNPRITVEEIGRLAKSSFLTFQVAEVIMKSAQWSGNIQVRLGLIHNPKTPQAFALRILPTLPDTEVRAIARAGTSMALKQAALKRLQERG